MNRLFLLRHASAAFGAPGSSDFDRALTGQGLAEAAALGVRLRDSALVPDRIICSTAKRARQTLEGLGEPFASDIPVVWLEELYRTHSDGYRMLIAGADDCGTLMVIGHNPTLEELLFESISSADRDTFLRAESAGMKQCTFAVLQFEGDYVPFANDTGKLTHFMTPER